MLGTSSFLADVFPHVHFGPIAERKDAHVFAGIEPGVVEIPDFRPLVLGIPLAEGVAEAEESLLGARLFLIATRAADAAIEAKLLDRREQRGNLQLVAADLPGDSTAMPFAMASSTVRTMSFAPSSCARRSRNSFNSGK